MYFNIQKSDHFLWSLKRTLLLYGYKRCTKPVSEKKAILSNPETIFSQQREVPHHQIGRCFPGNRGMHHNMEHTDTL